MVKLTGMLLYVVFFAIVPVGSSAAESADLSQFSPYKLPSKGQVTGFLAQSVNWYRSVSASQQLATDPSDLFFVDDDQPTATQIVRLSFDFARADAAMARISSQQGEPETTAIVVDSPDFARIIALKNQTDQALGSAKKDVAILSMKLATARWADRGRLHAALDDAQSRLDLLESGATVVEGLAQFLQTASAGQNHNGDLVSEVNDIAQTLPEVSNSSTPLTKSALQNAASRERTFTHESGILGLLSSVSMMESKLRSIDEMLRLTDHLILSEQSLRKPLAGVMRRLIEGGVANTLQSSDLSALQKEKVRLDALTAELNDISPAMVALDKQKALLAIYKAHLADWRNTVAQQNRRAWKKLLVQLIAVIAIIVLLAFIGQMLRGLTERHVHDAGRRRLITITRQVTTLLAIGVVVAAGLGAEWKSLATFFGLLTAGVAVALQNVILASLGYFLLVGKRGIRIGDRIQISGLTGDVIDMGFLQFQLKEYDPQKQQFTGHVATFSNSFVFVSPATGLVKINADAGESGAPEGMASPVALTSSQQVGCAGKS